MLRRERCSILLLMSLLFVAAFPLAANAQIRRMAELSATDIQALDRSRTVVIITGGLMEQHGPYLPSYTDGYYSEWIANRVAESIVARTGRTVVLFPAIPLGVGSPEDFGGRSPYSGSYTVRPATLRAVYMDLASALGTDGFRSILVINAHGSPSHNRALLEAADYFRDLFQGNMVPLSAYLFDATTNRPPIFTPAEAQENAGDVHSGATETSRMLFLTPELVHDGYRMATPQTAPTDSDLPRVAAAPAWPGYFGSPRLANASAGAEIMCRVVEDYSELALRVLDGFDPRGLPTFATTGDGAFRVLDDNLIRRSNSVETQQRDWLSRRGLR